MNTQLNRMEIAYLKNKSGGPVMQGDVVIIDSSTANSFTTTSIGSFIGGMIGVVLEPAGIVSDEFGSIAIAGYVPKINLSSSAALRDLFCTSSTPGLASPHSSPIMQGDFGTVLDIGTSPPALLLAAPYLTISAPDYILVRDEKASGTDGGTFTQGAWRTRDINTIVSDAGSHCSIGGNQITLEAGTYECDISVPSYYTRRTKSKLYNITDGATELLGTSVMVETSSTAGSTQYTFIKGKFTIASQKIFEIQNYCEQTCLNAGFGCEVGSLAGGEIEIYTVAEFWKVG